MAYFIGIDGGGTKTAFALGNEKGEILATTTLGGSSYMEIGVIGVVNLLMSGIKAILSEENITLSDCDSICIGLPCYGENKNKDQEITVKLTEILKPCKVTIVNDAVVGAAGALQSDIGIHLVAGTGSIAVGFDGYGKTVRCGGFSEIFGDEGSCYWVGKKVMEVFSKEADGRLPKGPLYDLIYKEFSLQEDFEFIGLVTDTIFPHRDKVAALQKIALEAALQRDVNAIRIYKEAAEELALIILGVKKQLQFSEYPVPVSYLGGLFHASQFVLPTLEKLIQEENCVLVEAKGSAVEGAILLAIKNR